MMEAEFSRANRWVGMCSYGFDSPGSLVCSYAHYGCWQLARIFLDKKPQDGRLEPIPLPYWEMGHGDLQVDRDRVVLVAGSLDHPLSLLEVTLEEGQFRVLCMENE